MIVQANMSKNYLRKTHSIGIRYFFKFFLGDKAWAQN